MKILIIEDDQGMQEVISQSLIKARYVVETASTLDEARSKLLLYEYDCVLLDIMLPDGNGLSLLKELADKKINRNVIILSARDSVDDKIEGLELGADDYLPKPFHLAELHARIRSLMRRRRDGEHTICLGNIELNPDQFSVKVGGKTLDVSRKEFDILHYLISRPDRVVSKEALAEAVWGDYIDQSDNFDFIYAHMKNLRKRLKAASADIELKTVYGFGYKITTP
ncbi:MAG: response regulator transcription factor [Bacteroidales bacterium]|jgi:DNA-binding response OmpR family regulator|nr:response regulator transcription factor [Bacteroidales bacterium]MEE0084104.1 response regulator transcription factor [Paludibacteraceae bacterium]